MAELSLRRRAWSARVRAYGPGADAIANHATISKWVLVTQSEARTAQVLAASTDRPRDWHALRERADVQAWTDDFSSVLPVLILR